MDTPRRLAVPLAIVLLLPACSAPAGRSGYPSLAPRPIEKSSFAEPTGPAAPAAAPDPALDRTIADTATRFDAIAKGFADDAAATEKAVRAAKGQPAGSDAWLDAQTALGTLDQWHSQLSTLSTDLDEQALGRAQTLAPPYPALDALQARVEAETDSEAATILRLGAGLAPA